MLTSSSAAMRCPRQSPESADMIGGLKLPRAGGIGVNANEVEGLPIWLLLSPLTTGVPAKGVGARQTCSVEVARTVAATRGRLSVACWLDALEGKRVCQSRESDRIETMQ